MHTSAQKGSQSSASTLHAGSSGVADQQSYALRQPQPTFANQTHRHGGEAAPNIVYQVLQQPGMPLDQSARRFFENRFGHDFADVRVHANEGAAQAADS